MNNPHRWNMKENCTDDGNPGTTQLLAEPVQHARVLRPVQWQQQHTLMQFMYSCTILFELLKYQMQDSRMTHRALSRQAVPQAFHLGFFHSGKMQHPQQSNPKQAPKPEFRQGDVPQGDMPNLHF